MQIIENTKRLMRTQIVEINQNEVKAAIAQFVKARLGLLDRVSSEAVVRIEADECGGGARVVVSSEVEMTEQVRPAAAHEREECAKLCEELALRSPENDADRDALMAGAAAIRART
jgi:hypothetical protein